MKVLKDFTCKVTKKRWLEGQEYKGERGKELTEKGFVSNAVTIKKEEKVEIKQDDVIKEKIQLPTLSTEKVKKKK
jgi:hypothetical protein